MKSMIYYPGFEVENEIWLKFSLLYLDELCPIIPQLYLDRSQYLSKKAIRVMDETNLIKPYKPEWAESMIASTIACEEFKKYLESPNLYYRMFSKTSDNDMLEKWRNARNQNYFLYEGKFSHEFSDFCIEEGLATSVDGGVRISRDLAHVYMSFLADVISKKQKKEMFTDISRYDTLLQYNDKQLVINNRENYETIKKHTELFVPVEIANIPLENIIELRNNRTFNECRKAYVHEIEEFMKRREVNLEYSLQEQLSIGKDIRKILCNSFGTVANACILLNEIAPVLNDDITPALALATIGAHIFNYEDKNTRQYLNELKTKIQAKRYVGTIKRSSELYETFRRRPYAF